MNFRKTLSAWKDDRLLGAVIRNSGYLFSSSTIAMILTSVQGILAAVLLGPSDYGALGILILFATSVNRLLSFRMGEVVIRYAGSALERGDRTQAAAVVKAAGLSEAVTSLAAYVILILLSPWAAQVFIKNPAAAPLIAYYGLALLANLVAETATAVLQLGSHYRGQAVVNVLQSLVTAAWITAAYFTGGGLVEVLNAYLAGKTINGLGLTLLALRRAPQHLGAGWLRTPLRTLSGWRGVARFALSTNLSGTINLVIRDSEVLWVGLFFNNAAAGYYKFALAMMSLILMPITPFISTTFPDITRSVARRDWPTLRRLLSRTTWIAGLWTTACALGLVTLGPWLLMWLKDGAYLPSFGAMLILLVGYGAANIFFWNRPLLLALGLPNYPLKVTALTGAVKTVLMFALARPLGYLFQAALLSGYFLVSIGLIVRRGLVEVAREERRPEDSSAEG